MGVAESIRGFWDDLFYSALVQRLETDLMRAISDAQQLRQDKDSVIADLRMEKTLLTAKVTMYEQNINQRVGIDPARVRSEKPSFASFKNPPVMTTWQKEQADHNAQIEKELAEEASATAGK
jgi:polyhydroxyalkanoate synthesis regulator protein